MVLYVPTGREEQFESEAETDPGLYHVLTSPDGKVLVHSSESTVGPRDMVLNVHDLANDDQLGRNEFFDCSGNCPLTASIQDNREVRVEVGGVVTIFP